MSSCVGPGQFRPLATKSNTAQTLPVRRTTSEFRVRTILFGALTILSCSEKLKLQFPEPPEGTEWLGVLLENESGKLVATSGLIDAKSSHAEFELDATEAKSAYLLGYSDLVLDPSKDATIVEAATGDPVLPRSPWTSSGVIGEGGVVELRESSSAYSRRLTHSGLAACPKIPSYEPIHVGCSKTCQVTTRRQGCRVVVDASSNCKLGNVELDIDAKGSFSEVISTTGFSSCLLERRAPASESLVCQWGDQACAIDFFDPQIAANFEFSEIELTDPEGVRRGVTSVAVSDDAIIVSAVDVEASGFPCGMQNPSRLFVLTHAGDLVSTATTVACLTDIRASGNSILGLWGSGPDAFGRLSMDGRVIGSGVIGDPTTSAVPIERARRFEVLSDKAYVALDNLVDNTVQERTFRLARIDLSTFRVEQLSEVFEGELVTIVVDGEAVVAVDDRRNSLRYFRSSDFAESEPVSVKQGVVTSQIPDAKYDEASGQIVVALSQDQSVLFVRERESVALASAFGSPIRPKRLAGFPAFSGTFLMSADHSSMGRATSLLLVDIENHRFLPPEVAFPTPVSRMTPDPISGNVLVITGEMRLYVVHAKE